MKKYIKYLIPSLITTLILLFAYCIKGIYPFGDMTIIHADLGQIFVTDYIYYIDAIKSGNLGNFIFTDLLFGGNVIYGDLYKFGFFSPFSLIYLLCNKNNLVYSISYILIFKVSLIALTSKIFFEKIFKEKNNFNTLCSVQYALSSYVLINYTSIIWLDIVALFPLILLALKDLFYGKGFWKYSLLLTLVLLIHYQLTFMIMCFILASSILVIRFYIEKENKKEVICNLGIGTLLGLLLPSVIFFPAINIYLESSRDSLNVVFASAGKLLITKCSYYLLCSTALFAIIRSYKYINKDKNIRFLLLIIAIVGIIPVFFEGINRLWHGGSYDSFPYRYGFIPIFFMLIASNYYYINYWNLEYDKKKSNHYVFPVQIALFVANIIIGIYLILMIELSNPAFYMRVWLLFMIIGFECMMIGFQKITYSYSNYKEKVLYTIAFFELIIFTCGYVGIKPENRGGKDHSDVSIFTALHITEELR